MGDASIQGLWCRLWLRGASIQRLRRLWLGLYSLGDHMSLCCTLGRHGNTGHLTRTFQAGRGYVTRRDVLKRPFQGLGRLDGGTDGRDVALRWNITRRHTHSRFLGAQRRLQQHVLGGDVARRRDGMVGSGRARQTVLLPHLLHGHSRNGPRQQDTFSGDVFRGFIWRPVSQCCAFHVP